MSAEIVNTIIGEVNRSRELLLKQNVYQAITSLEREYLVLKRDLDSLNRLISGVAQDRGEVTQFMHSEKYLSLIMDKSKLDHYETSRAMQLPTTLQIASVVCPMRFDSRSAASVSAVSPL